MTGLMNAENVFDFDIGKLCICGNGYMSGRELMDTLRSDYHLELEMALGDYALAMTSVCDTDEGFDRLINALIAIDSKCKAADHPKAIAASPLPQKRCTISEAVNADGEMLDIRHAEGKDLTRICPRLSAGHPDHRTR